MSFSNPGPLPFRASLHLLLLVLLVPLVTGCEIPNFQGPQLQDPPRGFHQDREVRQSRRMFPGREQVHHDVWVSAAWGDVTSIHINGHPGRTMRDDVRNALEAAKATVQEPVTFSEIREQIIDGRPAWGWLERMETDSTGLLWIAYRVAVPYDTITYTLELHSGDPLLKANPDTLLVLASSFAVGKVRLNTPLMVAVVVLLVVLVGYVRKREQEKARRLRDVTLKKVEVAPKEEESQILRPAPTDAPDPSEGGPPSGGRG